MKNIRAENFQPYNMLPRQHAAPTTCCQSNMLLTQYTARTICCSHSHLFAIFSSLLFRAMFKSKCSIYCKGRKFSALTTCCPDNMLLERTFIKRYNYRLCIFFGSGVYFYHLYTFLTLGYNFRFDFSKKFRIVFQ